MRGENMHPAERWIDLIEPKAADNRTGDEIAAEVIKNAGLKLKTSR